MRRINERAQWEGLTSYKTERMVLEGWGPVNLEAICLHIIYRNSAAFNEKGEVNLQQPWSDLDLNYPLIGTSMAVKDPPLPSRAAKFRWVTCKTYGLGWLIPNLPRPPVQSCSLCFTLNCAGSGSSHWEWPALITKGLTQIATSLVAVVVSLQATRLL